jgi:hypothetical protein
VAIVEANAIEQILPITFGQTVDGLCQALINLKGRKRFLAAQLPSKSLLRACAAGE